ncbi:hypothetical protein R1flu_017391 [Riccia fluitans]|uniref:F-box protein n=1 Tax=Riccia fluitans TaxID=41844 RepID=A0ABD1ZD55_9MARC
MATTRALSSICISEGLSLSLPLFASQKKSNIKIGSKGVTSRKHERAVVVKAALSSISKEKKAENGGIHWDTAIDFCKGWTDGNGMPVPLLQKRLETLSVLVLDRVEMHLILAVQRDNWNRLFHTTITLASVSAAASAAANAAVPTLGLHMVSIILGAGAAMLMALVSKFQPSQLAEEQRHAARFFKRLGADIESTLNVDPRLREDASCYWERSVGTVHALDQAFPLPLTPIVVEKFPKRVRPSKLSGEISIPQPECLSSERQISSANGWTSCRMEELQRTAQLLRTSDVKEYVDLAEKAKFINLVLAISSPLLATAAVIVNMAGCPSVAAAVGVGSLFFHTLSHALQMGAVYEVYRNCAGYYNDVVESIDENLRLPVERREDGAIFTHKVALLLGRNPSSTPMVPGDDKKAGALF